MIKSAITVADGLKTIVITVPAEPGNRDSGKKFLITEKPAIQAEKWGWRAILMLKGSGVAIPDNVQGLGMVGVAILGLNAFLQGTIRFEDLEPLLDELLTCVKIIRDPRHEDVATELMVEVDIQEVRTITGLRSEVLELHTNFSPAAGLSNLWSLIQMPRPSPD